MTLKNKMKQRTRALRYPRDRIPFKSGDAYANKDASIFSDYADGIISLKKAMMEMRINNGLDEITEEQFLNELVICGYSDVSRKMAELVGVVRQGRRRKALEKRAKHMKGLKKRRLAHRNSTGSTIEYVVIPEPPKKDKRKKKAAPPEMVAKLYSHGMSYEKIADICDCSMGDVIMVLREKGLVDVVL